MVREHEVHTATVDVELLSKVLLPHHGALQVPAGEAVSPRGRPTHYVLRLRLLPEGEVVRSALVTLTVQLTGAFQRCLKGTAGKDAVVVVLVVFLYVEVHAAVALVGISGGKDLLNGLNLLYDVAAGAGLYGRALAAQKAHGLMVALGVVLDNLHGLQLFQAGFLCYLILAFVGIVLQMSYVRDVAHVAYLVAKVFEQPEQHVVRDAGAGVAQMGVPVHGGAADVHSRPALMYGLEEFLLAGQRIC